MRQIKHIIVLLVIAMAVMLWNRHVPLSSPDGPQARRSAPGTPTRSGSDALPAEARDTLARIARGGPFGHSQDGVVFGNYEGLLPKQPRGYYHEYTVETPGAHNRGARRIITGGTPPEVWYYTDDHYRSFRRLELRS